MKDEDLHISAVTIGEIQSGIEITREQDQTKATEIERWLEQIAETHDVLRAWPIGGRTISSKTP